MRNACIVVLVLLLVASIATAETKVWYVHPDSTLNSIQKALNFCGDNDTVLVAPGTYYENIEWCRKEGICLMSEFGPSMTVIDGNNAGEVIKIPWNARVDERTIIEGFTIRNGSSTYCGGGICCFFHFPTIRNNKVVDNTACYCGGGIYLEWIVDLKGNPSGIIYNNEIANNSAHKGGGIGCLWGASVLIRNNQIIRNTANIGAGIYLDCYCLPMIDSCTIAHNNGDGIHSQWSAQIEGSDYINFNNIAHNLGYGIFHTDPMNHYELKAAQNWWGDPSGPGGFGPGTGDEVSDFVLFDPWLAAPVGVAERQDLRHKTRNIRLICQPNPFSHEMSIRLQGASVKRRTGETEMQIYDLSGRLVREFSLATSNSQLGTVVYWDGKDSRGQTVMPGAYFVRCETADGAIVKKIVRLE